MLVEQQLYNIQKLEKYSFKHIHNREFPNYISNDPLCSMNIQLMSVGNKYYPQVESTDNSVEPPSTYGFIFISIVLIAE